jgi:hypothetical protein
VQVVEGFPGIDPAEIKGLPVHRHVSATTPAAKRLTLVTLLVPYPLDDIRRVLHFIDDQGHGAAVSFVEPDGREYKVGLGLA